MSLEIEKANRNDESAVWVETFPPSRRKRTTILLAFVAFAVVVLVPIGVVRVGGRNNKESGLPAPITMPCQLMKTDSAPLFEAMRNGYPFSRSSPIQRFILGKNGEFAVVKLHYDEDKSILVLKNDGTATWKVVAAIVDNYGEWQVYGLDLAGTRLAYKAIGPDANCTSCDGYQVVDIDLETEQVVSVSTIIGLVNDQLYDGVFMSRNGNYAISVWESGTQVHDILTSEEQGFTIPNQIGESVLDAKIASDGINAAIYSHNLATNENTIFMKQLKSDGNWRDRRRSHPTFIAENFTPFFILGHRASGLVHCERREGVHEGRIRFWSLNEEREWVQESDDHHGDFIDHPCHTIALSDSHTKIMVQYVEEEKNVVAIGELNTQEAQWKKLAILELPLSHVIDEDPVGNSLSSFDAMGTFVSFLVNESHPSFPSSEHHFAIYKLTC